MIQPYIFRIVSEFYGISFLVFYSQSQSQTKSNWIEMAKANWIHTLSMQMEHEIELKNIVDRPGVKEHKVANDLLIQIE